MEKLLALGHPCPGCGISTSAPLCVCGHWVQLGPNHPMAAVEDSSALSWATRPLRGDVSLGIDFLLFFPKYLCWLLPEAVSDALEKAFPRGAAR